VYQDGNNANTVSEITGETTLMKKVPIRSVKILKKHSTGIWKIISAPNWKKGSGEYCFA